MKEEIHNWRGPIIVGGVGGSGTRVVALILQAIGFYLGNDLNDSLDNLWFTLLFKRPKWFLRNRNNKAEVARGLSISKQLLTGKRLFRVADWLFIVKAVVELAHQDGHDYLQTGGRIWAFKRLFRMIVRKPVAQHSFVGWGWKEPNSHLYLDHLAHAYDQLQYIHVIRNGLDMAYSRNQDQLFNWGPLYFDVAIPESQSLMPKASLSYWLAANKVCIENGRKLLGERFYLLNFDKLCMNPQKEIAQFLQFLDLSVKKEEFDALVRIPHIPKSKGRYLQEDLTIFSSHEIACVKELGFEVNC